MGISTLCGGYILWLLNFNSNKTVLVIANTQEVAMNLIKKIKIMYDSLPNWLKEQIVTNNKQSLEFKNKSIVKAAAATPNAGVSQALSLLVFDEAAVLNQSLAHQIWVSSQPTLSTGGNCIVGSSIITVKNEKTKISQNITIEQMHKEVLQKKIHYRDLKILTTLGWSVFQGIKKTNNKQIWTVKTEKSFLSGTSDHKIKLISGQFTELINLKFGDTLYSGDRVIKIINQHKKEDVYDVINVELNNQFYANGIVVSNCIMLSTPRGCVTGKTQITIKNQKTKKIKVTKIQNLYKKLHPKNNINFIYQVLTPSGWSDFTGIRKLYKDQILFIKTTSSKLFCSMDHKIKLITEQFINAQQLKIGDILYENQMVIGLNKLQNKQIAVYDLMDVKLYNQYYTNKLVSHNCGNTFHRLWVQAEQGVNRFNTIKLPWNLHPERDQAWRDAQTKQLGQKQAARQCDCQFASSGDNVISNEVLQALDKECISEPIQKMHHDELWVWRFPQKQENYILSADVARGDGSDFSAFQILSIQKNEQVAEFKGKIPTTEFGQLIVRTAKMYNDALVIVENASIGWAVLQEIINQGYKNVYYHKKDYKYIDPELHSKIRQSKTLEKQKDIIGFTTSSRTRPLIIERMITIIENREFIIHSKRLLNQFWTFIWLNGKQQAMRGYNDDLVMALAIGIWVRNTAYIIRKEARAFAKSRLASIDSGLNLKHQQENTVSSGFFNSHNNLDRLNQGIIDIGSETIDLNDFYFSKRTKDE